MTAHNISRTTLLAVLVATIAALVGRSWLQVQLIQDGMQALVASDVSYLVVPPILLLLLFPLWKGEKRFIADQFRVRDLSWRLVLSAIAIGLLVRLAWWCQLIAGVSFGVYSSSDPGAILGPVFSFQCGSAGVVALGFFVMAFLVPVIEEIVHRGYVQTAFRVHGRVTSIVLSALIFMLFHRYGSWPTIFFSGLIMGAQYWLTRSLWESLISHMVINGLIQIDWRCFAGHWNPHADSTPILLPGFLALSVLLLCLAALVFALKKIATGVSQTPR